MKALANIYFYNAMALANELRNGTISESRALKHLVATLVLGGIGFEVPITVEFQKSSPGLGLYIANVALFIVTGVISYYGTWLTHQVNAKGDGKEFFLRFASLTLPVGIRLVVHFVIVGILLVMFAMVLTSGIGEWGMYISWTLLYIVVIVFTAMFFLRMRRYIGVASGAKVDE